MLPEHLETLLSEAGYKNRSEFIRDLVRNRLVEREWELNEEVVGTMTIVYDHHRRGLTEKLTSLQHQSEGAILATTHVHLDEHTCIAEVSSVQSVPIRSTSTKVLSPFFSEI